MKTGYPIDKNWKSRLLVELFAVATSIVEWEDEVTVLDVLLLRDHVETMAAIIGHG